jgi:hypothetical protein
MKNIDIKIKQLADQQSITPPAFVWENIESSLRPKKENKSILWLFLGFLVVGSSLAWLYHYENQSSQEQNFIMASDVSENTENNIVSAKLIEESNAQINSEIFNEENPKRELNQPIDKKTTSPLSSEKIEQSKLNTGNVTKQNNNLNSSKAEVVVSDNSLASIDEDKINVSKLTSRLINPVSQIAGLSTILDYQRDQVLLDNDIVCPSFGGNKRISTFLEIGGLLGKHSKSIENGTNETLATLRNGSESEWYSWGFYGAAGINITPSFYFGVGVDWTQSKDKFYSAEEAITKMVITFDPNTGIPIDTSFITGNIVSQGEIRYNSIDIPVFVGFTKNYNTWDFGVELGGLFNLDFVTEGKIYNEAAEISYLDVEADVYKSSLGVGLKASLLIRKNLKNGLSIQMKPTYKTYFNEINSDQYSLPTKYSVFGINLGIRKDF